MPNTLREIIGDAFRESGLASWFSLEGQKSLAECLLAKMQMSLSSGNCPFDLERCALNPTGALNGKCLSCKSYLLSPISKFFETFIKGDMEADIRIETEEKARERLEEKIGELKPLEEDERMEEAIAALEKMVDEEVLTYYLETKGTDFVLKNIDLV